jgi:hypothetical protein
LAIYVHAITTRNHPGEIVMKFSVLRPFIVFCMLWLLTSSVVMANNNYNDGFLAAENGEYQKAAAQWQPLAGQGLAVAQFNMALLYHSGSGVAMDEARAVQLYHQAATNGYPYAQEYLAAGYQEGWFGLPKDQEKADYWSQRLQNDSQ